MQRYLSEDGDHLSDTDLAKVAEWVETYRGRLFDISWFMRILNERLARMANAEDGITGRFWEGRFRSQALLDEQSLLAAMTYVDLNPVRAGIADTPEKSAHTSIKLRIDTLKANKKPLAPASSEPAETPSPAGKLVLAPLLPFDPNLQRAAAIPFAFEDYLELVDTVGRVVRSDKRGAIPEKSPAILIRLDIDATHFINYASGFFHEFGAVVGTPLSMMQNAKARQRRCSRGISAAKAIFGRSAA